MASPASTACARARSARSALARRSGGIGLPASRSRAPRARRRSRPSTAASSPAPATSLVSRDPPGSICANTAECDGLIAVPGARRRRRRSGTRAGCTACPSIAIVLNRAWIRPLDLQQHPIPKFDLPSVRLTDLGRRRDTRRAADTRRQTPAPPAAGARRRVRRRRSCSSVAVGGGDAAPTTPAVPLDQWSYPFPHAGQWVVSTALAVDARASGPGIRRRADRATRTATAARRR